MNPWKFSLALLGAGTMLGISECGEPGDDDTQDPTPVDSPTPQPTLQPTPEPTPVPTATPEPTPVPTLESWHWLIGTWDVAIVYYSDGVFTPEGTGTGVQTVALSSDGNALLSEFQGETPYGETVGQGEFTVDSAGVFMLEWSDSLVEGGTMLSGGWEGSVVALSGYDQDRDCECMLEAELSDITSDSYTYALYVLGGYPYPESPALMMHYTRQ